MSRRRFIAALGGLLLAGAPATAQAQDAGQAALQKQMEAQQADLADQQARIRDLEKKLAAVLARQKELEEKATAPAPPSAPAAPPAPPDGAPPPSPAPAAPSGLDALLPEFLRNLTFSAYVQGQYEVHQDAQDQLDSSGNPLNTDRFVLRRARLKLQKDWQYASTMIETDGNTVNGPAFNLLHAEATVLYRGERPFTAPPIVALTFGQFDTPFGYELIESPKTRWFMERSLMSRALWPGEPDVGARLTSALGWFRGTVGLLNGNPMGEKVGFPLRDPAAAKDIVARAGVELEPLPWLSLAGGVSVYNGHGFHAGTPANKGSIQWVDTNGDGVLEPDEVTGITPQAATPSMGFDRWAVGGDLRAEAKSMLGITRLTFEVMVANNMDRGMFVADPVILHIDSREVGFSLGVTQEIFSYGVAGFRFDSYDPSSGDQTGLVGGTLLPLSQVIRTFSPLIGVALPDRFGLPARARLLFEYDVIKNQLGLTPQGVPTQLAMDTWTLRLQGSL